MAEPDVFCLKWNNHNSNLRAVLCNLLVDSEFCDVTLGAEGKLLHAHRLVLIACSDYFKVANHSLKSWWLYLKHRGSSVQCCQANIHSFSCPAYPTLNSGPFSTTCTMGR